MSSKRRGIDKESQVELSVRESVSEFVNLWSIEVLTHLKIFLVKKKFSVIKFFGLKFLGA